MSITTLFKNHSPSFSYDYNSPRIDKIYASSFLYGEWEDEILDAEIRDVTGPGDVQVLEDGAVLAEDGEDLVVADPVEDYMPELLHLLCGKQSILDFLTNI